MSIRRSVVRRSSTSTRAASPAFHWPKTRIRSSRSRSLTMMSVIVRCAQGHLFTTRWATGVSFKAIRLGRYRFQRCPVDGQWTFVTPVGDGDLSAGAIDVAQLADDGDIL
jgi:hypothetical protein